LFEESECFVFLSLACLHLWLSLFWLLSLNIYLSGTGLLSKPCCLIGQLFVICPDINLDCLLCLVICPIINLDCLKVTLATIDLGFPFRLVHDCHKIIMSNTLLLDSDVHVLLQQAGYQKDSILLFSSFSLCWYFILNPCSSMTLVSLGKVLDSWT
jgi:hypothetical protein